MLKVFIIGSGIAAVAAVLAAKEQGADVTLLAGRPGASALSSGGWDVAGPPLRQEGDWKSPLSAAESLKLLIRQNRHHPYAVMEETVGEVDSFVEQAIRKVSTSLDFPMIGSMSRPFVALTPLGTPKVTAYVSRSQGGGNLLEMKEGKLLILSFKGLPSFSARQMASLLRKGGFPGSVVGEELSLPFSFGSPFELAQKIDGEEQEPFLESLLAAIRRENPTHIALPPVMGLKNPSALLSRLQETVGGRPFETLALPPSVPGLRLKQAIDRFLRNQTHYLEGEAVGFEAAGRSIRRILTSHKGREERIDVERVILASGKFIGGGIVKEESFREPLFNLPLLQGGKRIEKVFIGKMVERSFLANHRLFSLGVKTNATLQPVDERGTLLYGNLWGAGSLLGGTNPSVDQSGMGVAIATGWLAGRSAT